MKLVSNPRATAYGKVLSKNIGSSFKNSLNLFLSQAFIKSLYHLISDSNLYHLSLNAGLPSNFAKRQDKNIHAIDRRNKYTRSIMQEKKPKMKNQRRIVHRTPFSISLL
jgi:hypothetical protein